MNVKIFVCFLVVVIIFSLGFLGGSIAFKYHGVGVTRIAPTYALDKGCIEQNGAYYPCSSSFLEILNKNGQSKATDFSDFWQEATKNTQFTVDSNPVEITDVQVFYRTDSHCTFLDTRKGTVLYDCKCYKNGNITYYSSGIENSQTYVVPTPAPTPCAWPVERTSYSFCGKVTINSSAEFDRLLKDIEKHSYHIQMDWMHLDYEYAHKTYDNTLPAPVNICIGIIPGDNFPMGSEWEGRMAYTVDNCSPLGSCDFDTLTLIPTPTPTPAFAFPYEFCGNGCVICTDHLGNCTYIPGK